MSNWAASMEESLGALKKAETTIGELRGKLATAEASRVELEKVANTKVAAAPAKFQFSDAAITKVAQVLVDNGTLLPEGVTKFASQMKQDPNFALEALEHISTLSSAPVLSGRGIPKTANTGTVKLASTDSDPEELELARQMVRNSA